MNVSSASVPLAIWRIATQRIAAERQRRDELHHGIAGGASQR